MDLPCPDGRIVVGVQEFGVCDLVVVVDGLASLAIVLAEV